MTSDDMTLLREFAEHGSEPAFTALVERHLALVHSTALRQTRCPDLAQEISQAVFIVLARKAAQLDPHTILPAWLYRTTRYVAANALTLRRRRRERENRAAQETMNNQLSSAPDSDAEALWRQLAPLLDDAMASLAERDRAPLLLRYFESCTWREVAQLTDLTEDAAQKRVSRALEKLRKFLGRRGLTTTSALLAGALSANSVDAAPAGLAHSVSAAAVLKGATASTTISTLVTSAMKTAFWTRPKIIAACSAAIVLAGGTLTLLAQRTDQPRAQIPYQILEDGLFFEKSINPTNLVFHVLVGARNANPVDIHLEIHSPSRGHIPVHLGAKGQLLDFPCDDDLRRENPFVVSDQPKGTVGLGYWVFVPRPEGLTFRYRHLANAVEEANKAAAHAAEISRTDFGQSLPLFPPVINGIDFHFPKASARKANVTLMLADGPRKYIADAHGIIKMRINPRLKDENPELFFSERPDWIGIAHF